MSYASTVAVARSGATSKIGTLIAMSLGMLIAQIDTSVVNLALPAIARDLKAGVGALQWVVDSYNLVYGGLLLTGGTLGDLFGRKRVVMLGVALFCVGSIICALAPTAPWLIAGRVAAGIGAAMLVPLTLANVVVAYPDPRERAHAIGVWAGVNGLAFIIGPTLGGFLVESSGWRSIFWMVVPIGAVTLALTARVVRESTGDGDRQLDPAGQGFLIAGLSALTLVAIEGRDWGWQSAPTLACLLAGVAASILFVMVEHGKEHGLVPLPFFAIRRFSGGLVVTAAMTFGMYGMLFILPIYLQTVRGGTALEAGLEMLPMSVIFFIVSQASGWLTHRIGVRGMLLVGMGGMGGGVLALSLAGPGASLSWVMAWLMVIGIGLGFNTGPVLSLVIGSLPSERAGTASGVANTARLTGATLGVALLGTLFAAHAGPGAGAQHYLDGMAAAFHVGGAVLLLGGAVAALTARVPK